MKQIIVAMIIGLIVYLPLNALLVNTAVATRVTFLIASAPLFLIGCGMLFYFSSKKNNHTLALEQDNNETKLKLLQ